MKPRTMVFIALTALLQVGAHAQGKFGFGAVFGEPTGIAWKYRTTMHNAFDGAIGFSPYDRFRIHVDYLWHSQSFEDMHFALHYGVGAVAGFGRTAYFVETTRGERYFLRERDLGFGLRGVFGVTYQIPRSPVDLFLEAAPVLILDPASGLGLDVGLGIRFYP